MKWHVLTVPGFSAERDANIEHLRTLTDVCVHEDPERRGVLFNWSTALRCAQDDGTEWSMIVQDDASPIEGWERHLPEVLRCCPLMDKQGRRVQSLSLFYLSSWGAKAGRRGIPYAVHQGLMWGVATVLRSELLSTLVPFVEDVVSQAYGDDEPEHVYWRKWDEAVLEAYNQLYGTTGALVARSLFDHPEWESTMGHHGIRRVAPAMTIRDPAPMWSARPSFVQWNHKLSEQSVGLARIMRARGW